MLSLVHVLSTRLNQALSRGTAATGSFGAGVAATFIFLELQPKIDHGHDLIGDSIEFVILAGFHAVFSLHHLAHGSPARGQRRFVIVLATAFAYNWLLVFSFPRSNGAYDLVITGLLVLHLFFYDRSIREESPEANDAWGRWLLVGATMLGWCDLWDLGHPSPLMEDIMIGLLAGAIIDQNFTVELTITNETRSVWLILGVVTYLGIFPLSMMFTGGRPRNDRRDRIRPDRPVPSPREIPVLSTDRGWSPCRINRPIRRIPHSPRQVRGRIGIARSVGRVIGRCPLQGPILWNTSMTPTRLIVLLLATMSMSLSAVAEDLFRVEAVGQTATVTVVGNSLPDILDDIGDLAGRFAVLEGQAFVATVDYAGIQSAIQVRYDPGTGTDSATLVIERLAGTDVGDIPVFDEADGDLGRQLEDYFLKNGSKLLSDFQRAIATQSPVGVVSGNPVSAIGRLLGYRERRFGTGRIRFRGSAGIVESGLDARGLVMGADQEPPPGNDDRDAGTRDPAGVTSALAVTGAAIQAGGYSGTTATLEPSFAFDFGERVSVVFGVPFGWTSWQGSNSWTLGVDLDVPITLVHHQGRIPGQDDAGSPDIRWSVVPGGGALAAFSYELIQGGLLWNAGVLNNIEIYDERHSLSFTQQYLHLDSIRLEYDDYIVDYGGTQEALQFGLRYALGIGDGCAVYVGGGWSRILDGNAYVPDWTTTQAGLAWTFPNGSLISIGFEGQFARNDWRSYGGQISLMFPF